jgi:putative transposase
MGTKRYPADLTDEQWAVVEPLIPPKRGPGRPRELDLRRVLDAILYLTRTGCQWRFLPHDFPDHDSVRYWFDKWARDGTLARVRDALREQVRAKDRPQPRTTASVDSQTTDSAGTREARGFDGGKRLEGRKRHIIVDSLGLLLAVAVTCGRTTDAQGGQLCLGQMSPTTYPAIRAVFADRACECEGFPQAVEDWRPGCRLNVIARPEGKRGFVKLKIRWVVERTFAWLARNRRLCRSYEHTVASEVTFIKVAMIGRMLGRLAPGPAQSPFRYR